MAEARQRDKSSANTKEKITNFEQQKQRKNVENHQNKLPEIRQIPVWKSTETIEVNGLEWQAIAKHFESINEAFMAFHSVINRNMLAGKIQVEFQKLNKQTGDYESMSVDEQAPYQEEFASVLSQANEIAAKAVQNTQQAERLDTIVNEHGKPIREEEQAKPNLTSV